MARWNLNQSGLKASIQYDKTKSVDDSTWHLEQDERPFLEQAKRDREAGTIDTQSGYRKFATIPEIVAIEIKDKHGIDVHAEDFFHDVDKKARFFTIIRQDYPHLVVNKD